MNNMFSSDSTDEDLKNQVLLRALSNKKPKAYGKPLIGNEQTAGVARAAHNGLMSFFGGTPQFKQDETDNSSKLSDQIALLNYKDSLKDPEDEILSRRLKESQIGAYDAMANATPGEGQIKVGNKIVNDPSYKRQPTQEERQRELEDEVNKSELISVAKSLPKLDQAFASSKQLHDLFDKAVSPQSVKPNDFIGSIGQRLSGIPKTSAAFLGMNPELNRYKAQRKAFAGNIAKGGFGESGMLTQQDIERISSILPDEYSNKQESDIAWQEIENVLSSARERFNKKKNEYINPNQNPYDAMKPSQTPAFVGGVGNNRIVQSQKSGGVIHEDANGNRAIVYPDGTIEEIPDTRISPVAATRG